MNIFRHTQFLKIVFLHTITAFGGPQAHLGLILKNFVEKKKYITKEELLEYNSFCQLLPGPSSTQLITLIGYKRGGIPLAVITLLIWILPASLIMGILSFLVTHIDHKKQFLNLFRFIQPMAIGFLIYAAYITFKNAVNNTITRVIFLLSTLITLVFFKNPWIFPFLILTGGIVTNFSNKRIIDKNIKPIRAPKWTNIWLFLLLFLIIGFLSETSRKNNWPERRAYNLSENFYRFGSLVFGGGDVLLPMMLDQYVARPTLTKIKKNNPNIIKIDQPDLLTGFGFVRAIPGPVFSVSAFVGGLALSEDGWKMQVLGCFIGVVSIFMPGTLLLLFFFPIWENLKKIVFVYRALEGINAVSVGLIVAASLYLLTTFSFQLPLNEQLLSLLVIILSFFINFNYRIYSTVMVIFCIFLGWIF